jgi:2-hydroxychromene-2-carboxylate isomerase
VAPSSAAFYFDLASPLAYLAAEQVLHTFAGAPAPFEWQPVLSSALGANPAEGLDEPVFRERIEREAAALGLQPVRWPAPFPFDSALAMRVATYAKSIGRTVPFAQAAFRQAFAGGRSLAELDNVLISAAACEMHPRAIKQAQERQTVAEELMSATAKAAEEGVTGVPALRIDEHVWVGERAIEDAAAHLRAATPASA